MNIFMIILSVACLTTSIFLLSKYGAKKKEGVEYVNSERKDF